MNGITFWNKVSELIEACVGDYSSSYTVCAPITDQDWGLYVEVDIFFGAENEYRIIFEVDEDDPEEIAIQYDGFQAEAGIQAVWAELFFQAEAKIK